MKFDFKHNIFSRWWFSFVLIPVLSFAFYFIPGYSDEGKIIFDWTIFLFLALILQAWNGKTWGATSKLPHTFYIVSCCFVMMSGTFFIQSYNWFIIDGHKTNLQHYYYEHMWDWVANMILGAITCATLFVVKALVKWLIKSAFMKVDKSLTEAEEHKATVIELTKELEITKAKLAEYEEPKKDWKFWKW